MIPRSSSARAACLVACAALLLLGACQSADARASAPPPEPENRRVELSGEFTGTAEVTGIAAAERVVTLRREDGLQFEVVAGEGVRNFAQIAVGDAVRIRYQAVLAATRLPGGSAVQPDQGAVMAARAGEGAKPGAGVGLALSARVTIESLDPEGGIVVFSLASGELVAHRVLTREGWDFLQDLKVGDAVQLDYGEAVALTVEKL